MAAVFPNLRPESYQPHWLHGSDRNWQETNCYVDVWIEVLSAIGYEPCAAMGFTVTQDFEGDQFTFFKYPPEDLDLLYHISVQELAIYDRVEAHAIAQIERGRLPLVEVDSYYLPDTDGVSYKIEHTKSTVGLNRIDIDGRSAEYFHNCGFYYVTGDDFDRLFRRAPRVPRNESADDDTLFPYVEFVKFGRAPAVETLPQLAIERLLYHIARRPEHNPLREFAGALESDLEALLERDNADFHKYAFNTARQFGANFDLLAAHLDWIAQQGGPRATGAIEASQSIAAVAKVLQFQMARAVARKRAKGLKEGVTPIADAYDAAFEDLERHFGRVEHGRFGNAVVPAVRGLQEVCR